MAERIVAVIADAHNDLLLSSRTGSSGSARRTSSRGRGCRSSKRGRRPSGLPDLRRARAAARGNPPRGARPGNLVPPSRARERRSGVAVRTRSDLDRVESGERIGLMLALEGVEPFGYELGGRPVLGARVEDRRADVEPAEPLRRRHSGRRRPFAARPLTVTRARGAPGRARSCARIADALRRVPRAYEGRVCVTHAGCRGVNDHPRNLTDAQLRALADRDGIFGLMLHPIAVDPERPTIERAIDHLEHGIDLVGPDRVCLGADWTKRLQELLRAPLPPDACCRPGWRSERRSRA